MASMNQGLTERTTLLGDIVEGDGEDDAISIGACSTGNRALDVAVNASVLEEGKLRQSGLVDDADRVSANCSSSLGQGLGRKGERKDGGGTHFVSCGGGCCDGYCGCCCWWW